MGRAMIEAVVALAGRSSICPPLCLLEIFSKILRFPAIDTSSTTWAFGLMTGTVQGFACLQSDRQTPQTRQTASSWEHSLSFYWTSWIIFTTEVVSSTTLLRDLCYASSPSALNSALGVTCGYNPCVSLGTAAQLKKRRLSKLNQMGIHYNLPSLIAFSTSEAPWSSMLMLR